MNIRSVRGPIMPPMHSAQLIAVLALIASTCVAQERGEPIDTKSIRRVELRECDALKRGGAFGLMLAMRDGAACEVVRRGELNVDGRKLTVYLPDGPYSLENAGRSDFEVENDATCIAIDSDNDGKL